MSLEALNQAVEEHRPVGVYALFSGGHDSLVNTHLTAQHPSFAGVLHMNTGIGIEETREFVRETCRRFGWPLVEKFPQRTTYEAMVMKHGMPGGPVKHGIFYHRLKSESVDAHVADVKRHRRDRVVLSSGVRKQESARRMRLHPVPIEADGVRVWVNPILDFSARDVNAYISKHGLERNPVVDKIHRSGECLCGAMAHPDELKEIAFWFPEVAARIRGLERQCFERGLPYNWGSKPSPIVDPRQGRLRLCSSCETRWEAEAEGETE